MKITAALMVALTMALAGCAAESADETEEVDVDTEEAVQAPAPDLSTVEPQQNAGYVWRSWWGGGCRTCR